MRIGIDISQIQYIGTGIARFTEGLIQSICEYGFDHEWHFYFHSYRSCVPTPVKNKLAQHSFIHLHTKKVSQEAHRFITYYLPPIAQVYDKHIYPQWHRLDWFISSDWIEPHLSIRKSTIVHDLAFIHYPETIHPKILTTQRSRLARVVRECDIIFTDSTHTHDDLKAGFSDIKGEVIVDYPGVTPISVNESEKIDDIVSEPYILTVGKREPRKNLDRLVNAYKKSNLSYPLVIVGPDGWGEEVVGGKNIIITGYVNESKLQSLYHHAHAFVYPSLYEGFGYPVAEALSAGLPVATSNTSSMKEIAGDAAIVFNPLSEEDITHALIKICANEEVREELRTKGPLRASLFTWKKYYDTFIYSLQSGL